MKMIIEISDLTHQHVKDGFRSADVAEALFMAVKNGQPISEGREILSKEIQK